MGTYIVGDIHGCFDLWISLKQQIEEQDSDAKFVLVGDIVDRGPQVKEMIDWAMQNISVGGKYQMVRGNHEDLKIRWAGQYRVYDYEKNTAYFKEFALEHYGFHDFCKKNYQTDGEVNAVIDWFRSLPLYKELSVQYGNTTVNYIVCHGNMDECFLTDDGRVNQRMVAMMNGKEDILWDRNFYGHPWNYNTIVVHGHSPTLMEELICGGAAPGMIDFKENDINVDCGACFEEFPQSNLGAIRLEDFQEFYANPLDEDVLHDLLSGVFERKRTKEELMKKYGISSAKKGR